MKRYSKVTHCVAECMDCDWRDGNYETAQATAATHAKKHKHYVHIVVETTGYYLGCDEKSPCQ